MRVSSSPKNVRSLEDRLGTEETTFDIEDRMRNNGRASSHHFTQKTERPKLRGRGRGRSRGLRRNFKQDILKEVGAIVKK